MTSVGEIEIEAVYGQDPETERWLSPVRVAWGVEGRQRLTPLLQERLCFTATKTGSYEAAAQVAGKWGVLTDDSTIHAHVQRAGERAETACQQRVQKALASETRGQVIRCAEAGLPAKKKFSLVIMMDGCQLRERGPQWGWKPPEAEAERVEWHELKAAIIFRLDQHVETQTGRGLILEKSYVAWRGDAHEFGQRLYAEALRRGLVQAEKVYVVADGAVWIWNLVEDRFKRAVGVLDWYHATQHLWAVASALFEDANQAQQWLQPLLHQLSEGQEVKVLETLDDLLSLCTQLKGESSEVVQREVEYFRDHRHHLHYQQMEAQGCPKGSGAVESLCAQIQNRFKRTGQFWTLPGQRHLLALELALRNNDWDELWDVAA